VPTTNAHPCVTRLSSYCARFDSIWGNGFFSSLRLVAPLLRVLVTFLLKVLVTFLIESACHTFIESACHLFIESACHLFIEGGQIMLLSLHGTSLHGVYMRVRSWLVVAVMGGGGGRLPFLKTCGRFATCTSSTILPSG
jgi:hypothetical protein